MLKKTLLPSGAAAAACHVTTEASARQYRRPAASPKSVCDIAIYMRLPTARARSRPF
jgi:hypothetical protein